jgi:hypothetical protein
MNRFSVLHDPRLFFKTFINEPAPECDPIYVEQCQDADSFRQVLIGAETSKLLLEFARQKYSERLDSVNRLDAKRDAFAKFAGGMIAFLATAVKAFDVSPHLPMKFSILCLLVSVVILLASRRTIRVPFQASIQSVRAGIGRVENPSDWIAGSLHKSTEGLRVVEDIIAAHLNFALCWLLLGLVALAPVIFTIGH